MTHNQCKKPMLYLAAPLFSAAERSYNIFLKGVVEDFFDVYLPQEDGLLIIDLIAAGMNPKQAASKIFNNDINAIHRSDVILILLDGRAVDEGAAVELGYAFCLGKVCVSLQTDFRRLAPFGNNPMLSGAIAHEFTCVESLTSWMQEFSSSFIRPSA